MTDANDPSCPTPFSSYEKIEEPCLQMTNLQKLIHITQHRRLKSPTPYLGKKEHPRRSMRRVRNQRNIARDGLDNTNN